MKHFFLISNTHKDENYELVHRAAEYLQKKGAFAVCRENTGDKPPAGCECIVSLGGDGTLLRAARQYADANIPFVGINIGTIGYLTEGSEAGMEQVLDCLLKDEYQEERRMMIYARLMRNGKYVGRHRALDDIVVARNGSMKVIRLNVYVNGQFLTEYRADGLIASTPTGSTAYTFSVGGPIAEPTARIIILSPIACHSTNSRSLILSASDHLEVEVVGNTLDEENGTEYKVWFDGDKQLRLLPGDRLEITQASTYITTLKLNNRSFVEILRAKLSV